VSDPSSETQITDRDLALPPDEPRLGEAVRDEARVGEAARDEARVDEAARDEARVDEAARDEPRRDAADRDRGDLPLATPEAARDSGVLGGPDAGGAPAAPPGGGIEVEDDGLPSPDTMREAMKAVMDPELGYNVVDLGLLYDIEKQDDGHVQVTMTLTTMGCPLTELIHQQVSVVLGSLPGVRSVDVEFTFSPPWSPAMMSDEVRDELRAMGMNV
jgi:metal-sulfur cluster biosynthetic enzyme